jgi:hypothetical protein
MVGYHNAIKADRYDSLRFGDVEHPLEHHRAVPLLPQRLQVGPVKGASQFGADEGQHVLHVAAFAIPRKRGGLVIKVASDHAGRTAQRQSISGVICGGTLTPART